jgi:hypothetical protein
VLSVVPAAGEAGGSFRYAKSAPVVRIPGMPAADPERAAAEAARRARSKVRRYCAANRLNRLGTLTYRGEGNHDPQALREHVGLFFRRLRSQLGGDPLAYVWVPEWHKTGHGLHVHFAVGRYVPRTVIESAWPHGFVHIKLIGDLPVGSGALAQARKAAGYLSKYVAKSFDDGARVPGLHRYEVAQGFTPEVEQLEAPTLDALFLAAFERMGGPAETYWNSSQNENWAGPPAVWMQWPG